MKERFVQISNGSWVVMDVEQIRHLNMLSSSGDPAKISEAFAKWEKFQSRFINKSP